MTKGFKDKSGKFRPTENKKDVRMSRDQTAKTQGIRLERENMNKIDRNEWKKIVASNKSIVDDQRKLQKYFKKVDTPSGFAFSDLDHYKLIEKRLDEKLEKLAKKHDYIPEGYTKYSAWMDHWDVRMERELPARVDVSHIERSKEQEGGHVKYWAENFDEGIMASLVDGDFPDEMEIRISTPDDRFSVRGHRSIMDKMSYTDFEKKVLDHIERHEMMKKR